MLYSIVIPCYRSDQTIRKVVELTMEEFRKMERPVPEFVLVDDCSPDGGKTRAYTPSDGNHYYKWAA